MCTPWDINKCVIEEEIRKEIYEEFKSEKSSYKLWDKVHDRFDKKIKEKCGINKQCMSDPNKNFKFWQEDYCIWLDRFCNKCEKIYEGYNCPANHKSRCSNGSYL